MDFFTQTPVSAFIFIVTIVTSIYALSNESISQSFVMRPYQVVHNKKFFQVITSGLIHGSWFHLFVNMLTFYFFAFYLEGIFVQYDTFLHPGMGYLGHIKFFLLYVLSLVFSDVSTLIKHKNDPAYATLGASGAISAIVTSFILFNPSAKIGVYFIFPMPAWLFGILYIAYSYYASRRSGDNINHDAHLWGALSGIVLTVIFYPQVIEMFLQQF